MSARNWYYIRKKQKQYLKSLEDETNKEKQSVKY